MGKVPLGPSMSGWRRLLEEESEHQWLSFAAFTVIVIIGAVLIDWSSDLSGVHQGSSLEVEGIVIDAAGDSILYQTEDGIRITHNDMTNNAQYATCLEEYEDITLACLGTEGMLGILGMEALFVIQSGANLVLETSLQAMYLETVWHC